MYCKFRNNDRRIIKNLCINSSKVYCKFLLSRNAQVLARVLIVAKCIVNYNEVFNQGRKEKVLIVAKCIVNQFFDTLILLKFLVLIVAKCIVNLLGNCCKLTLF